MASFRSNEEFFDAVRGLIGKLEAGGHASAAAELKAGFGCINGLTDGLAMFLESVEKIQRSHARDFAAEERDTLESIRKAAHKAVYRR